MSRFGKTHSTEDLIQPGYPKIVMAGRRAGKTEMIRQIVEEMDQQVAASIFGTTSNVSNTAPTTMTTTTILADIKRVKATIEANSPPGGWVNGGFVSPPPAPVMPMFETDRYQPLTKGQSMPNDIIDPNPQATALSTKLNAGFKASPHALGPFQLTGPLSTSIKERNGAYKTKSFLGDEAFNPTTSYVGKKGDIIVVFKASVPTQYAFMEMSLGKAVDNLKGFQVYADGIAENSVQSVIASFDEAALATQAAEKAGMLDNPEFASW